MCLPLACTLVARRVMFNNKSNIISQFVDFIPPSNVFAVKARPLTTLADLYIPYIVISCAGDATSRHTLPQNR